MKTVNKVLNNDMLIAAKRLLLDNKEVYLEIAFEVYLHDIGIKSNNIFICKDKNKKELYARFISNKNLVHKYKEMTRRHLSLRFYPNGGKYTNLIIKYIINKTNTVNKKKQNNTNRLNALFFDENIPQKEDMNKIKNIDMLTESILNTGEDTVNNEYKSTVNYENTLTPSLLS